MAVRRRALIVVAAVAVVGLLLWGTQRSRQSASVKAPAAKTGERQSGTFARGPAARAAGRRIAGMVLLDGHGVDGAAVRVVGIADGVGPAGVVTDAAGEFDLGKLPVGKYLVVVEKAHMSGASAFVDLRDLKTDSEHVVLALHACDAAVHGVVRDAAGGPIAGARIARGSFETLLPGPAAETDANGNYELCAVADDALLVASADGYAQDRAYVRISGHIRHDFLLSPEAVIAGRVVRADDKTPVADAIVTVQPERLEGPGTMPLRAVSDQDGRFSVSGAGVGRYLLMAEADGLATQRPIPVLAEISAPQADLVCEVAAAASVSGTVVEAGKGIAGAHIALYPRTRHTYRTELETVTDAEGHFVFDHVAPDEYTPQVTEYGMAEGAKPLSVDARGLADVKIEVETLASVSGQVRRGGKPVDGADVTIGNRRAVADAEGHYVVHGLRPGTATVYAQSNRVGAFTRGVTVTLAKGEQKTGVDLELDLSGSISGTVVDQDGAPVGGVLVSFSLLHGRDFGAATTAEDGTFTATALSGGGDYTYQVRAGDGERVAYASADGKRFAPIAVPDAQSRITGVVIRIKRQLLTISGRVVTSAGEPMADVIVRADHSGYGFGLAAARTDETGAFSIRDLADGTYALRATSTRGEQVEENVAAGRQDVVIRVPDAGQIVGTLEDFSDAPEVIAIHRGMPVGIYHAMISGNHFTVRGVPPGAYEISATSQTGMGKASVTVTEHGDAKVTIRRTGFGSVSGRLVDASHQPVAGIRCGFIGPMSSRAVTGADGTFRIDRIPAGEARISCYGDAGHAVERVTVTVGETANVELVAEPNQPSARAYAGFQVERQFSDVLVKSVERGGPADQAGLHAGDFLRQIEGMPIPPMFSLEWIESMPPGTPIKLVIERDSKQQTVTLTLAARPGP